jgi:hypothetical protein
MNEDTKGWLVAQALQSELEEIEKVGGVWKDVINSLRRTGGKWLESTGSKAGRAATKGRSGRAAGSGAYKYVSNPGGKGTWESTGKGGIRDALKHYAGRALTEAPEAVVGAAGLGALAL